MSKTLEEFKADADRLYERIRDQGKTIALLEIAQAFVTIYGEGVDEMITKRQLAVTPAVSDREM